MRLDLWTEERMRYVEFGYPHAARKALHAAMVTFFGDNKLPDVDIRARTLHDFRFGDARITTVIVEERLAEAYLEMVEKTIRPYPEPSDPTWAFALEKRAQRERGEAPPLGRHADVVEDILGPRGP